jgi:hypothetical protein
MILIKENKLKVGPFGLNTEKILLLISGMNQFQKQNKVEKTIDNMLQFGFTPVNYEKFKQGINDIGNIELLDRVHRVYIPDNYEINHVSALKLLSKKIVSELNLIEGEDFSIIGDANWSHEDMNARVIIPADIIPENDALNSLVSHVKGLIDAKGAYKYKSSGMFIFYFKTILPEHLEILEQEEIRESILIEYK